MFLCVNANYLQFNRKINFIILSTAQIYRRNSPKNSLQEENRTHKKTKTRTIYTKFSDYEMPIMNDDLIESKITLNVM